MSTASDGKGFSLIAVRAHGARYFALQAQPVRPADIGELTKPPAPGTKPVSIAIKMRLTLRHCPYCGQRFDQLINGHDEESGFNYHGKRYLAGWLGRWTTADPLGAVDGVNLYRFGRNNPIRFSDPSGTDSEEQQYSIPKFVTVKPAGAQTEVGGEELASAYADELGVSREAVDPTSKDFQENIKREGEFNRVAQDALAGERYFDDPYFRETVDYGLLSDEGKEEYAEQEWSVHRGPNVDAPIPEGFDALQAKLNRWGLNEAHNAGVLQGFELAGLAQLGRWTVRKASETLSGAPAKASVGAVPKPGSLSNEATREWYKAQLDELPSRLDQGLPLKERALQAFEMRNAVKMQARELMADQAAAAGLPAPRTLADVVGRAYKAGARGDDVWRYVLKGSGKSNPNVDAALGL